MEDPALSSGHPRPAASPTASGEPIPDGMLSLETLIGVLDTELAVAMRSRADTSVEEADTSELMIRFSIGEVVFGVTTDQMVEIEAVPPLTFVPRVAPAVCGLTNLRGEIIVVLDLARHFGAGHQTSEVSTTRRMIVVREACLGRSAGVLVDRVFGIGPFYRDQLDSASETVPASVKPFVIGSLPLGEQDITMIDLQAFARSAEAQEPWLDA